MSRISNLTTVKIGILNSWNSYWFDDYYYSYLLFNDLKMKDYFSSIFYSLKIISDYFNIYRFSNSIVLLKTNLVFLNNLRFNNITIEDLQRVGGEYGLFFNKKFWNKFLLNLKFIYITKVKLYSNSINKKLINSYLLIDSFIINIYKHFFGCLTHNNFLFLFDSSPSLIESTIYNSFNIRSSSFKGGGRYINNHLTYKNIYAFFSYYIEFISYSFNRYNVNEFKTLTYFSYNINRYSFLFLLNFLFLFKYLLLLNILYKLKIYNINKFLNIINALNLKKNYLYKNIINFNTLDKSLLIYNTRQNIVKSMFNLLKQKIETSIRLYENKDIYFYFNIYINKIPFFTSAKLITDLIAFFLESGNKIVKSFFFIYNLQYKFFKKKRRLEYSYYFNKNKYKSEEDSVHFLKYLFHYASKRFPLIGIRIECSGSFKKGKMSRSYYYTSWIKNYLLTGSMPNNTIISDIDYYQYYVILPSSSVGIKTWIFLETYLYNANNIYIGIVY